MRLTCYLAELRGKRTRKEISEASGINVATISQIEVGRLLPLEKQVEPLEHAYGMPITQWYSPTALLAIQEDEQA